MGCVGKYFLNVAQTECSVQCDAHATKCTDYWKATTCDMKNKYYKNAAGRCTYCDIPCNGPRTGADNGKKGTTYFWTGTYCSHCDPNADGCTAATSTTTCKSGFKAVGGGPCYAKCETKQAEAGGKGKCFTCGSKVQNGRCYSAYQGLECTKGYHIQGAGAGHCCSN